MRVYDTFDVGPPSDAPRRVGAAAGASPVSLPHLTHNIPGIGGRLKSRPEDFVVEELPLYPPAGEGTHLLITIEKSGVSTAAAADMIARALGRRRHDVGFAGQKDVRAVTRQTLSIEHVDIDRAAGLELPGIRVLGVARHGHKLRLGHLAGNRFALKVRQMAMDAAGALDAARAVVDVLQRRGVPNYFGPQRFGAAGNNGAIGRAALLGRYQEAVDGIVGAEGASDRPEVREARRLYRSRRYPEAAQMFPRSFQSEARICRTLARRGDARIASSTSTPARVSCSTTCCPGASTGWTASRTVTWRGSTLMAHALWS